MRAGWELSEGFTGLVALYIWIPAIIFAFGWLRPLPCTLAVCAILVLVARAAMVALRGMKTVNWRRELPALAVLGLIGLGWVFISGCGGWAFENGDYFKHNGMLGDLIHRSWPVSYPATENPSLVGSLVYYIAYYLPAALVGKWLGYRAGSDFMLVWAWLGTLLCLRAFSALGSQAQTFRRHVLSALFFIVASGADFLGTYLVRGTPPGLGEHIEWWNGMCEYASNMTSLFWVPQHALAGWLATAVVLSDRRDRRSLTHAFQVVAGTVLWSPFVTVGLLPFLLVRTLRLREKPSYAMLIQGALLGVWGVVMSLYLMAGRDKVPMHWVFSNPNYTLLHLLEFYLLEFGLLAIVVWGCPELKPARWSLVVAVVCLLFLPLPAVGDRSDLTMRSSIPGLFCVSVFVIRGLFSVGMPRFERRTLEFLVLVGSLTALSELARSLNNWPSERYVPNHYTSALQMQWDEAHQYIATPRRLVSAWLFK